MNNTYDKQFNLSNFSGPLVRGLQIIKIENGIEKDIILLKLSEMIMYPPKSYGNIKRTYMIYLGDRLTKKCDYLNNYTNKNIALKSIKQLKKEY